MPAEAGLWNLRGELLGEPAGLVVGILPRRRLHQVGRWPLERPCNPPVEGQLGVADRVDHHPGWAERTARLVQQAAALLGALP